MRKNYHLLASTASAETAMNRQLIWELAKHPETNLDRLTVLREQPNAQRELASILCRESVLAVNQLAATMEEAISALWQCNELLDRSLNPGRC